MKYLSLFSSSRGLFRFFIAMIVVISQNIGYIQYNWSVSDYLVSSDSEQSASTSNWLLDTISEQFSRESSASETHAVGPITWTDFDKTIINWGNLTKNNWPSGWNADAHSTDFLCGDGYVEFTWTFDPRSPLTMVWLNEDPATNASYTSIDYAIYLSNWNLYVYENASSKWLMGTWAEWDVF